MRLESYCLHGAEEDHPNDTVISRLFEDLLEEHADIKNKIAIVHATSKVEVTYKELNQNANAMARLLLRIIKKEGMRPNQDGDYIVALRFVPDENLITLILALFKAGIAYLPLAPNWPEGRVQHIMEEAEPIMVITNAKTDILYKAQKPLPADKKRNVYQYSELYNEALKTNTSLLNLPSNQILNNSLKGNRLYTVLYTSGSTGTPKGVRHLHKAALNRFFWQWKTFPYEEDEVCIFKTTLTFVDSVTEIWSPLLCGKKLVIFPTKITQNVEQFVQALEDHKIGRVFVVTSLIRSILAYASLDKSKKRLASVKMWDCSAEPVTRDLLLSFFNYFPQGHMISNFYGSTEMMDVTFETFKSGNDVLDSIYNEKIPIGYPVDNTKAFVLDSDMKPVAAGQIGHLYIASRNLGDGYVGAKKGSFLKNAFQEKNEKSSEDYDVMYNTGDFAMIMENRIYYEGRADSQVKVRGHRVDMSEIEKAVMDVPEVTKAALLCYQPGQLNQKILCYYTVKEACLMSEPKLEVKLSQVLPDYMMPKLMKLTTMPLLTNGKIDRQSLLGKFEDLLKCGNFVFTEEDFAGMHDSEQVKAKVLLESVANVIQNPDKKPSLDDKFFAIGGDSINMVIVISKISDHGFRISVTDFVTSCNLKQIVKKMTIEDISMDIEHTMPSKENESNYTSGDLQEEHKRDVLDMVSRSFADKGDLTTLADVTYEVLMEQLEILWASMVQANLSLVVYDRNKKLIGACINFDARAPEAAPLCATSAFSRDDQRREQSAEQQENQDDVEGVPMTVVEFLDAIEEPLKDKHIPKEMGTYIYTSMLGTAKHLSPVENVQVSLFMEQENIRRGKDRGFLGIFTANANRLTQLISRQLGYQILATVQVNQYEDENGSRPFAKASDDLVTEIAIKKF